MSNADIGTGNERLASLLEKGSIESFSDLNGLQGVSLNTEDAERLAELQEGFIVDSLEEGMNTVGKIETGVEATGPFEAKINRVRNFLVSIRSVEDMPSEAMAEIVESLLEINETIYSPEFTDRQKLFLEFLLGICFSEINVRIGLIVGKKMAEKDEQFTDHKIAIDRLSFKQGIESQSKFSEGLKPAAAVDDALLAMMNEVFGDDAEAYWDSYYAALSELKEYERISKRIISLRVVPAGSDDRKILSMAQALHWQGFGTDGAIFGKIPQLDKEWIKKLSLGWHNEGRPFGEKLKYFRSIFSVVKQHEASVVSNEIGTRKFEDDTVCIADGGAGPTSRGVHLIAKALEAKGLKVRVMASDVDASSIAKLAALKGKIPPNDIGLKATTIEDVIRWDCNEEWKDSPQDKVDVFVFSAVLHQVVDRGIVAMRTATRAVKPGGLIALADAGEYVHIQSQMLAFNVVDRENSVPPDIFRIVTFDRMKIPMEKNQDGGDVKYYKIAYPIREHRMATPRGVARHAGTGIYEGNVFKVICVPEDVIKQLDSPGITNEKRDEIVEPFIKMDLALIPGECASINGAATEVLAK